MVRQQHASVLAALMMVAAFLFGFQTGMDLSESLQLQIFAKSLSYDRNLTGGNIVLIAASASNQNQSRMKSVIESAARNEKLIKNSFELKPTIHVFSGRTSLEEALAGAHLVYLCDDLSAKQVVDVVSVCAEKGILTTTGVIDLVKKGLVSLSAVKVSTTAKPIVNITRVKKEKHFFIYSFQKVCRIEK